MDAENWKQKYLTSLDNLEKQENKWQATEALLKQGLTRVARAAQGLDVTLDDDLALLRKILHKDIDLQQLESVVSDLTQSVKRLDEHRNDKNTAHHPQELLQEKQSGGFFSRLFGSDTRHAISEQTHVVTDKPAVPQINEFCIQLLDKLSLPAELTDQVENLKDRFGEGLSDRSVTSALTAIANLISAMRRQMEEENEELQAFLHQLGDNLKEIDQNLSGAQNAHKKSMNSGHEFDAVVHAHVQDIQSTVEAAPESNQLKQQIQGWLDAIRKHFEQYRETEETRQQQLEVQLAHLNNRVHGMENEGEKLRQRLQEKHEQAVRDPLTGLHNRLAYDERVMQEFARWKRYGQPMVLMMIDVDHFKHINDTYGHKAGDKALVLIADQLRNHLRESDFLARFGGEEFVVLMPETGLESAVIAAEKLRVAVEQCQFHYQNTQVSITFSAGLAQLRKNDSPESLFQRADAAMYRAKEVGRNQCLIEKFS